MKTKLILFLFSALAFVGCSKEGVNSIYPTQPAVPGEIKNLEKAPKPIFRFTWNGFIANPNNTCQSYPCGSCIGLCIKFNARVGTLTRSDLDDYQNYAVLTLNGSNTQMTFSPDMSMDNGDGKVRIEENYDLGSAVASYLGKTKVVINAGTYTINYLTSPNVYGTVTFNVTVTP